ncbi:uncharacterized protein sstn isoform X2 [Periplaneta americana]|uniref:uncharacterized protein sstn isoform X2 n=1 Tax=Periplaneta americana TaxID=6978 RepID=UPI0037E8A8EF
MSESEGREQGRGSVNDMVATLQARREELEAKLHDKNRELKLLCIQEAELTGVLPPETPLEPGEFPPVFRRRVGTAFTYPENLINNNKLKSKEEETLAALELECKIQTGIAEAALGLANDTTANVECVDRDTGANALSHDGGVSLSPLSPEAVPGETRYWDIRHSATYDGISRHTMRDTKGHPQLQRHGSGGYFTCGQLSGPGMGGGNGHYMQQYSNLGLDLESIRTRLDVGSTLTTAATLPSYWMRHDYGPYIEVDSGIRLTTAPMTRYQASQPSNQNQVRWHQERNRFGSLDRRKAPAPSHSSSSPCLESWSTEDLEVQCQMPMAHQGVMFTAPKYGHSPAHLSLLCPPTEGKQNRVEESHRQHVLHPTRPVGDGGGGALLPNQTYPEHSLGMDGHGGLLRTQSLGNVDPQPSDTLSRKHKEKEWYETSLDAPPSQESQSRPASSMRKRSPEPGGPAASDASSNLSRSSSNVSSEQHPQYRVHHVSTAKNETFDTVVPFESPKNHTVVQAGKWQPYREVTKPFEMADFYKYSTKFRKNQELGRASVAPGSDPSLHHQQPQQQQQLSYSPNSPGYHPHTHNGPGMCHSRGQQVESPTNSPGYHPHTLNGPGMCHSRGQQVESPTPQQKGIYQPLQPMTCQPVDPALRSRVVSPNASLDGSLVLGSGESLADAFSTEMLAWYQDQNIPRSATLV